MEKIREENARAAVLQLMVIDIHTNDKRSDYYVHDNQIEAAKKRDKKIDKILN